MREGNKGTTKNNLIHYSARLHHWRRSETVQTALFQPTRTDGNNAAARRDFYAEKCHVHGISTAVNHTLPKRPARYGRTDKERNGNKWRRTVALIFTTSSNDNSLGVRCSERRNTALESRCLNQSVAAEDAPMRWKMKIHRAAGGKLSTRQFPIWKLMALFARGGGITALLREEIRGISEHFRSASRCRDLPEEFSDLARHASKISYPTNSDNLSNSLSLSFWNSSRWWRRLHRDVDRRDEMISSRVCSQ